MGIERGGTARINDGGGAAQEAFGPLQGLQSLLPTAPTAMASAPMAGMGAVGDAVAAPSLTGTAVDVAAPTAPTTGAPSSLPPDLAGAQMLSGPTAGRQGLGQRVPPSLAALLKVRAY